MMEYNYYHKAEDEVIDESDKDSYCRECLEDCVAAGYPTPCGARIGEDIDEDYCYRRVYTARHDIKLIRMMVDEILKVVDDPGVKEKVIEVGAVLRKEAKKK